MRSNGFLLRRRRMGNEQWIIRTAREAAETPKVKDKKMQHYLYKGDIFCNLQIPVLKSEWEN
ncbi:hypothetical protein BROC_00492 [Candidatus Brocadiaceae bacterium]|nr:hypothetical protein BROC_00492 [Candidatus Brocadiaceae bacterium]